MRSNLVVSANIIIKTVTEKRLGAETAIMAYKAHQAHSAHKANEPNRPYAPSA